MIHFLKGVALTNHVMSWDGNSTMTSGAAHAGIQKNGMTVFSAHQMGTARMGADPKKSCVDPQGECWEVCAGRTWS